MVMRHLENRVGFVVICFGGTVARVVDVLAMPKKH